MIKVIYLHMNLHMFLFMKRKLREIGGSLVITIPKQVCDLYKFNSGDEFELEPIGIGELKLKKV